MVLPPMRQLRERGWDVQCLGLTLAGPRLQDAGFPAMTYRDLLPANAESTLRLGREILAENHNPASGIPEEESLAYLGLNLEDLFEQLGEEAARARYAQYRRHAFLPMNTMRRLIERIQPDVVMATNSPRSERAALVAAHNQGVPTAAIDDFFAERPAFFPPFVPDLDADLLFAASAVGRDNFLSQEPPVHGRVLFSGNPSFDRLTAVRAMNREEARRRLGVDGQLAVVMTQNHFDMERIDALLQSVRDRIPGLTFAIRLHPSVRGKTTVPPWVLDVTPTPLDDVLIAADVLLTVHSTTMLEALLVGLPVVQLGRPLAVTDYTIERIEEAPLWEIGLSTLAESEPELIEAISNAIERDLREEVMRRAEAMFGLPGTATELIVAALEQVVDERQRRVTP